MNPTTPDPCINQRIVELSKDPDLIDRLTASFAPSIHGHAEIKLALLYHLVGGVSKTRDGLTSRGAIHVLLIGDHGTGKTKLLQYAHTLSDVVSITGTGLDINGLTASVTLDQQGSSIIKEGALVKADQRCLHIDKLDKMNPELYPVLETAMEQQYYPIAQNGVTTFLDTRVSILATANPLLGRYNPYQTIAQNINLPPGLLSCFDLIFIIRDVPDPDLDKTLAEKILGIGDSGSGEDETIIDRALLGAYLSEASMVEPMMSLEVKSMLRDFYLALRRGSEGGAVAVTPRQLLSLVRLVEATAKLHLREAVSASDVEAAVRVYSRFLEQVGVDPVSGHYDVDVLFTGRPSVLSRRLLKLVEVFTEMELITGIVKESELHGVMFTRYGMNRRTVARLLRILMKENILTSPEPGYYKRKR